MRSWIDAALSPAFRVRGETCLSILIYHRVLRLPDPMRPEEITSGEFLRQMQTLARRFQVLPLAEAVELLPMRKLPERSVCITFDDGYADNHDVALPVLASLGLPATFFVASGYLDGGRMWNDTIIEAMRAAQGSEIDLSPLKVGLGVMSLAGPAERARIAEGLIRRLKHLAPQERAAKVRWLEGRVGANLPDNLMMSSEQLRSLVAQGMDIGAHTRFHPILARLTDAQAHEEIAGGREDLQHLLDRPVDLFAYPNGKPGMDFSERDARLVADLGFRAAVTTEPGVSISSTSAWALKRFTPWDKAPARFVVRMALNCRAGR